MMNVEIHLFIGSILMLFLAILLAINQYRGRLPAHTDLRNVKKKTSKEEKRIHPRYDTSLRIKYYKHPSDEGTSWVKDISRGGIRLFLNNPFEIGTLLEIEINLPYDTRPVLAQSNVIWTEENDAGLSFSDVDQEDINRIFRYIGHKQQIKASKI